MHKGIILLFKNEKHPSSWETRVESFLEPYGNGQVWDWYVIGGRWSGTLHPLNSNFDKLAREHFKNLKGEKEAEWISNKDVEEQAEILDAIWKKLGGKGKDPWHRDNYEPSGYGDDIKPLAKCIDIVKDWQQDPEEEFKVHMDRAEKHYPKDTWEENPFNRNMYCYNVGQAGKALGQDFYFDTNVYNTEEWDWSIPEDVENYTAVIIDIHN